jgi:hypothetical protein
MNTFTDMCAVWLADFYIAATLLLAATFVVNRFLRQPVQRLAVAWATTIGLGGLIVLCALPDRPSVSWRFILEEQVEAIAPNEADDAPATPAAEETNTSDSTARSEAFPVPADFPLPATRED